MPITRSNKGAPRRAETSAEENSDGATESMTATTSGTETTVTSGTTCTTQTTQDSETTRTTASQHTEQSKIRDQPIKNKEWGSNMTMVPMGPPRAPSVRSTRSRKRELEAKEELARLELERIKAEATLARARLERAQYEDAVSSDEDREPEDRAAHVQNWVQTTVCEEIIMDNEDQRRHRDNRNTEKSESKKSDIAVFAHEIVKALNTRQQPPKYIHELPYFDGNISEWMAFKTVYEDTAPMFNDVQNIARIRKAVKNSAREAIKSLLYSDCSPSEVMQALQRRFGRPDALVLYELDKLKVMVKPSDSARDICVFANQVNNSVAAIKGLSKPQYLHSPEMVKIIIDKLPTVIKYRWYDYAADADDHLPEMVKIAEFLNREADRCGAFATPENKDKGRRVFNKFATHAVKENTTQVRDYKITCPHCEEGHYLTDCRKFLNASTQDRWEIVKKLKLCFKCLRSRHRKDACKRPSCAICKRWHHRLLHADEGRTPTSPDQQCAHTHTEQQTEPSQLTELTTNLTAAKVNKAYLKMIPVELFGPKHSTTVLALLDEGSTISLLDSTIAKDLGVEGPTEAFALQTVGGKCILNPNSRRIHLKIKGVHHNKVATLRGVRTIDNLHLSPQRLTEVNINQYPHLKDIARQVCYEEQTPKLLIGQDNWELIVTRSMKRGKAGQPVASMTTLGWVLHGCDTRAVNFVDVCAHLNEAGEDEDLNQLMKYHFSIESLGVAPKRPSTDADARALKILENTSRRLEDGRFEVGLLWKKENETIPESRSLAERRLYTLEKKLDKSVELNTAYTAQMKNLLDQKYAEEAPETKNMKKWYLPHFSVVHPQKKKLRVVFDAAAKAGGKSLNDMLLPGPDLLQSLFGVLLRFREGPVAIAADIKEMFLQIRIRPEDRDYLRFLWRNSKEEPYREYRMTSVMFGATSSPCTAIYIKNRNAEEMKSQYPEATQAVVRNHYMDDYLQSFRDEDKARRIASEVDQIHKKAGFELRGWSSNRQPVAAKFISQAEDRKNEVSIINKEEKTLGMKWHITEDALGFNTNLRNIPQQVANGNAPPTKRQATSAVMSTFDPMGLIIPVLIQGKKLLQDIWISAIDWDEEVKPREYENWCKYLASLKILQHLLVPRCIAPDHTEGELHVFCDASETAFAAAAYWRSATKNVTLIAAKAKVTPLKPISIPRLELQAALLATRLASTITKELELVTNDVTYWTDSTTVLAWIKTDPRTFKTFVAHRLAEIEETTRPQQWRWVPTAMNPADDATRKTPLNFDVNHRWFVGPAFLRAPREEWPKPKATQIPKTGEEKESHITAAIITKNEEITPDPERFSSWTRLLRATARVLQFLMLCRPGKVYAARKRDKLTDPNWNKTRKMENRSTRIRINKKPIRKYLVIEESFMEQAEKLLIRRCQRESFNEEYTRLKKKEQLPRSSRLKRIDVELENDVIQLRGRINAVKGVCNQYKSPMIIDGRHKIGKLIIEHYHRKFNHGNHLTVMNEIRQRYYVLGLRTTLRSLASSCQWCRVYREKPKVLPEGDLPIERLRHGTPPFHNTAVDYFGPMTVTIGRRHEKRWGALFTCLTVRAVHIEIASSLSTDSMIMALRRFIARRGTPKVIFSDNGTNFVGANRELKEAMEALRTSELAAATQHLRITWKFIPPGAPNMGGAWERLVRSIKNALTTTLRERHPKEEVLHTLLLEAEHVVNSRPLTDLQPLEEEALTPNHFLIGRSCGATSIGIFNEGDMVGPNTWKTAQRLADQFWSKWVREYLPTLLPRKTSGSETARALQVGDIVVVGDHTLPRCCWPKGTIAQVYPGADGQVRVVDVATAGGVMRRPSSRVVAIVPVESPQAEDGASHEGETVGDTPDLGLL